MPSPIFATGDIPLAVQVIEGTTGSSSVENPEFATVTPASTPVRIVLWRVVFQTCRGKLYLHHISLSSTNTGKEALERLKLEY